MGKVRWGGGKVVLVYRCVQVGTGEIGRYSVKNFTMTASGTVESNGKLGQAKNGKKGRC